MDAEINHIVDLLTRIAVAMEARLELGSEPAAPEQLARIEKRLHEALSPSPSPPVVQPEPTGPYVTIGWFCKQLGISQATYYRHVKRGHALPKPVKPFGPRTNVSKLLRKEVDAFFAQIARARDGRRPVGRPKGSAQWLQVEADDGTVYRSKDGWKTVWRRDRERPDRYQRVDGNEAEMARTLARKEGGS